MWLGGGRGRGDRHIGRFVAAGLYDNHPFDGAQIKSLQHRLGRIFGPLGKVLTAGGQSTMTSTSVPQGIFLTIFGWTAHLAGAFRRPRLA